MTQQQKQELTSIIQIEIETLNEYINIKRLKLIAESKLCVSSINELGM